MAEPTGSNKGSTILGPRLALLGALSGKAPVPLARPVTLIGSRQNAHLHLLSRQVSKAHALIVQSEGRFYIRDLASREHTFVNGEAIREAALNDEDKIRIGTFAFCFRNERGDALSRRRLKIPPPAALDVVGANAPTPIAERVVLIGRRSASDISLAQSTVSTAHAVIFQMNGKHYVRDLGSRTGTLVNGIAVHQLELKHGDVIRIGETDLRYLPAPEQAQAPAAAPLDEPTAMPAEPLSGILAEAPLAEGPAAEVAPAVAKAQADVARQGAEQDLLPLALASTEPPAAPAAQPTAEPLAVSEPAQLSSADVPASAAETAQAPLPGPAGAEPLATTDVASATANATPTDSTTTARPTDAVDGADESSPQPAATSSAEDLLPLDLALDAAPEAPVPPLPSPAREEPVLGAEDEPEAGPPAVRIAPAELAVEAKDSASQATQVLSLGQDAAAPADSVAASSADRAPASVPAVAFAGPAAPQHEDDQQVLIDLENDPDVSGSADTLLMPRPPSQPAPKPVLSDRIVDELPDEGSGEDLRAVEPLAQADAAVSAAAAADAATSSGGASPAFGDQLQVEPAAMVEEEDLAVVAEFSQTPLPATGEALAHDPVQAPQPAPDSELPLSQAEEPAKTDELLGSARRGWRGLSRLFGRHGAAKPETTDQSKAIASSMPASQPPPAVSSLPTQSDTPADAAPLSPSTGKALDAAQAASGDVVLDLGQDTPSQPVQPPVEDTPAQPAVDLAEDGPPEPVAATADEGAARPGFAADAQTPGVLPTAETIPVEAAPAAIDIPPAQAAQEGMADTQDAVANQPDLAEDVPAQATAEAQLTELRAERPAAAQAEAVDELPTTGPVEVAAVLEPLLPQDATAASPEGPATVADAGVSAADGGTGAWPVSYSSASAPEEGRLEVPSDQRAVPDQMAPAAIQPPPLASAMAATDQDRTTTLTAAGLASVVEDTPPDAGDVESSIATADKDLEVATPPAGPAGPPSPEPLPQQLPLALEPPVLASLDASSAESVVPTVPESPPPSASAAPSVSAVGFPDWGANQSSFLGGALLVLDGLPAPASVGNLGVAIATPAVGPADAFMPAAAEALAARAQPSGPAGAGSLSTSAADAADRSPASGVGPVQAGRSGPIDNGPDDDEAYNHVKAAALEPEPEQPIGPPAASEVVSDRIEKVGTAFDGLVLEPAGSGADIFSQLFGPSLGKATSADWPSRRATPASGPAPVPSSASRALAASASAPQPPVVQPAAAADQVSTPAVPQATAAVTAPDAALPSSPEPPGVPLQPSAERPAVESAGPALGPREEIARLLRPNMQAAGPAADLDDELAALPEAEAADQSGDLGPPRARRHRRFFSVPMLLLLMLLCMLLAAVAIYALWQRSTTIEGAMQFRNYQSLPTEKEKNDLRMSQLKLLQNRDDVLRRSALAILQGQYPQRTPGFLADAVQFSRAMLDVKPLWPEDRADPEGRPDTLVLRIPTADVAGDRERLHALLLAAYHENAHWLGNADKAHQRVDDLKDAAAGQEREIARLKDSLQQLEAASKNRPANEQVRALEADVTRLRSALDDAATAAARAKGELEQARQAQADAQGPVGSLEQTLGSDSELQRMQVELQQLSQRLSAASSPQAAQAEESRRSLDASLEQFQQQVAAIQGRSKETPELKAYVASVQALQDGMRQLIDGLMERQQKQQQGLSDLKRMLDDLVELKREELWDADPQLADLRKQLDWATRKYNAASSSGGGSSKETDQLKAEVDHLTAQVEARKAAIGNDKLYSEAIGRLQQFIDEGNRQLIKDRKQVDSSLARLQKDFVQSQPALQKLPRDQRALAADLAKRLEAITDARRRYAQTMDAITASAAGDLQKLGADVASLQNKVASRKRDLIQQYEQQRLARGQQVRKALEQQEARLTDAQHLEAEARAAWERKDKQLAEAKAAVSAAQDAAVKMQTARTELAKREQELQQDRDELERRQGLIGHVVEPVMPRPEQVQAVAAPADHRPLYTAGSWGAIAVIFAGLILLASRSAHAAPLAALPLGADPDPALASEPSRSGDANTPM